MSTVAEQRVGLCGMGWGGVVGKGWGEVGEDGVRWGGEGWGEVGQDGLGWGRVGASAPSIVS